jgi:hypothetical protein
MIIQSVSKMFHVVKFRDGQQGLLTILPLLMNVERTLSSQTAAKLTRSRKPTQSNSVHFTFETKMPADLNKVLVEIKMSHMLR